MTSKAESQTSSGTRDRTIALVLLFVAPALFASNMLIARWVADEVPPNALAFWRWFMTLMLLLPIAGAGLWRYRRAALREWRDLLGLGALGMGVCGVFVYVGADTTSATNIGLIYAISPILIVMGDGLIFGTRLGFRQLAGAGLAVAGVLWIISHGDLATLLALDFVIGDLWILGGAIGWAVYSLMLKHRPTAMPLQTRFAAIVTAGVLILLPFHIGEAVWVELPSLNQTTVTAVALLAVFASFGAYQAWGKVISVLDASTTSLLMYLIPLYNGALAWVLLGEPVRDYHLYGAALVLPGIFLATRR
ncbi:MAG: DMT family transporter [Alphaproteobacteria bacterium]|nr:DMT family transporter [Alphaproteobacteria bacterium]